MKSLKYIIGKDTKFNNDEYQLAWYEVSDKHEFSKLIKEIRLLSTTDRDSLINKVGDCLQFSKYIGGFDKRKDAVSDAQSTLMTCKKHYPVNFQRFVMGIIKNSSGEPESLDFEYISYIDPVTETIIELDNVF